MTDVNKKSTRRAFFLNGGAVLGAGVATTVGAVSLTATAQGVAPGATLAEDREAIRQLHLAFVSSDAATSLFEEQLSGYRQTASQLKDEVRLSEDGLHATATFHCEVELCTPLQDDCTAAQMARLQGLMASRRWETGRFEASYVKTRGQWTLESIRYLRS